MPLSPRPAADVRRDGNRLRGEPSLYLRQHAHNPVDWYPWGAEALDLARAADRPVFLSIGYSSCHWCHVMEKEAFADEAIADFLNAHFVCIKVDREERPDLDAVYMDAVQALTGQGGWPLSAFLTPEGKPFHGGTYFPPEHFRHVIEQVAALWTTRPAELREQAERVVAHAATLPDWTRTGAPTLDDGPLTAAGARAAAQYDDDHAGFRQRHKFPQPVKWRFLLREWERTGDIDLRRMLEATLTAFAGGGLRDQLGGGFHRYTVDPAWTVPHFEKMLYDNAQLALLFLEAGAALARPDLTEVARDTLAFLLREMRLPGGGFAASFDADSGGDEGSFYLWTPAELARVAGAADGPALAFHLGVGAHGNFEGSDRSVPTRRTVGRGAADDPEGDTDAAGARLFRRHRAALLAERATRTPPGRDDKVVTAWNGLVIAALARGATACGEPEFAAAAADAATFLLARHRRPDGSLGRASSDGRPSGEGVVDDYACLADGLLELFLATGDTAWLAAARDLADRARRRFAHPDGGFYLTADVDGGVADENAAVEAAGAATPLGRTIELFDGVVPSGSAVQLQVMLKLGAVTGDPSWEEDAVAALRARAGLLAGGGPDVAGWLAALGLALRPPRVVVVAGDADDPAVAALLAAARGRREGDGLVVRVPAGGLAAEAAALAPALAGKAARDGRPLAYVCRGRTCGAPVATPDALRDQLAG